MVTATLPDSRPKTKPHFPSAVKKRKEAASPTAAFGLLLFFTRFFPAALACQSFFYTLLLAGLQIKRVALNLLNDVFLLHLAFEAAQCIFQRLALLQSNFSQRNYTPRLVLIGPDSYCKGSAYKSRVMYDSRPERRIAARVRGPTLFSVCYP